MGHQAEPDGAVPAEQIGLSVREAQAAPVPKDAGSWAAKVERLQVQRSDGLRGSNVAGRRLTGPVQGFGKMWQKTYRMDIGTVATPRQVIATWKAHFPEFWPRGNRFSGALAGLSPGDVALLDLAVGGGVKLSTGVFVLYADEESFTLMTPEGHMFAGWITFSAQQAGEPTLVQAQVLMRASDPLYEAALALGGHRQEDRFWAATMAALAQRLGAAGAAVQTTAVCIDSRRQWRHAGNVWHNAAIRSVLASPRRLFARRPRAAA
jgi:hypothetical protein